MILLAAQAASARQAQINKKERSYLTSLFYFLRNKKIFVIFMSTEVITTKLIALDASTQSTGLAIFENKNLIYYECIKENSKDAIERIHSMAERVKICIEQYGPIDTLILEEVPPMTGKSMHTYKVLMWLQSAIMFMVKNLNNKVKVEFIYPSSWRTKCGIKTGKKTRAELKKADIEFVKETYNINVNDDIADAIGIGHSYIYSGSTGELNWE